MSSPETTSEGSIKHPPSNVDSTVRNIAFGVVTGIVGAALLYGHLIALGFTIYIALIIFVLFFNSRLQNITPIQRNMPIVLPLLFFATTLAVRSEDALNLWNFVIVIFVVLILIHYFRGGNIAQNDLLGHVLTSFHTAIAIMRQPIEELLKIRDWLVFHKPNWSSLIPILRGLLITIPILAIFILLFSSADEEFAKLTNSIFKFFTLSSIDFSYIIIAALLGWLAIGGFGLALSDRKINQYPSLGSPQFPKESIVRQTIPSVYLGFIEATILLSAVCAVFAVFVGLQFTYLFGGLHNIGKFSYADYVHQGFVELVIVGILTLILVYTLNRIVTRNTSRQINILRSLLTVLIILSSIILLSAFQRLRLYEEVYGFTTLRLLIYVFILWLSVLFVGFTLSIYWHPASANIFGLTTLIAFLGFFATLNVINPDAFVANKMIERNDVDPIYLVSLSNEAIPAMVMLVDAPEPGLRTMVRQTLRIRWNNLNRSSDFRDFSVGRSTALAALTPIYDKLPDDGVVSQFYTAEDFKFLKLGMNFRTLVRRFGPPALYGYGFYSSDERERNALLAHYVLNDGRFVFIRIDNALGIISACMTGDPKTANMNQCETTLLP